MKDEIELYNISFFNFEGRVTLKRCPLNQQIHIHARTHRAVFKHTLGYLSVCVSVYQLMYL